MEFLNISVMIAVMVTKAAICQTTKRYISIENYRLKDNPIFDVGVTSDECTNVSDNCQCGSTTIKCAVQCGKMENCKSFSIKKDLSRCRLYSVSIAAIGSTPVPDIEWDTYAFDRTWNPIVKYSVGNSEYNSLDTAEFYTTDNYTASFPDDICGVDPAQKCSRPYKHTLQKELLAHDAVTQIKISIYKDGSEVAWVTFAKNPGYDSDGWFDPSRVIDSYPWDKIQLQESTARFITKIGNQKRKNYWSISEGTKYNTNNVGAMSAHAHWLTMVTGTSCDMYEDTVLPAILYSKLAGPVYPATRSVGFVQSNPDSHQYDTPGTQASTVCSTYLHTRLATKAEIEYERINKDYSCCAAGWFTDTSYPSGLHAAFPMTYYRAGCGGPGLLSWTTNTAVSTGVYCKVNNGKYFPTITVNANPKEMANKVSAGGRYWIIFND